MGIVPEQRLGRGCTTDVSVAQAPSRSESPEGTQRVQSFLGRLVAVVDREDRLVGRLSSLLREIADLSLNDRGAADSLRTTLITRVADSGLTIDRPGLRLHEILARMVEQAIVTGEVAAEDAEIMIDTIMAMMIGLISNPSPLVSSNAVTGLSHLIAGRLFESSALGAPETQSSLLRGRS